MNEEIKKVWFNKGRAWNCYACNPPYDEDSIIKEGLPYEVWIVTPTLDSDNK